MCGRTRLFAFYVQDKTGVKKTLQARLRWHADRAAQMGRWLAGLDAGIFDVDTAQRLLNGEGTFEGKR
jgi:hypothetical protein